MAQRPDIRRNGSYGSDTSSVYSGRSGSIGSGDSLYSVWSSSDSDSFVWRDDPWGFYGVGGAVTRYVDERDDRRRRFASHILSGPFAQFYKKQRHSSSNSRPGRSAASSRSSSRPSNGVNSPGRGHNQHFQPRPVSVEPQFHQEHFQPPPPPPPPFHSQGFQGPPPPPPPPPAPAHAGFEGGFIQLGGPPPPPQHPDDPWDNAGAYEGAHVYDY
ncbi:hypothetical protein F5B19DRAFT_311101 [Rostrohypoxylon terebratum]|nr:hypothetical protein F5B19DRAFT_311101 [Rostrohypoxylon terebratum]